MAKAKEREDKVDNEPSRIKRAAKFMFDVPSWLAWGFIAETWSWLSRMFFDAFKIKHVEHHETFDEAMQRLNVSAEDLKKQSALFLKSSWSFLVLSILMIVYLAYIWSKSIFFAKLVGIIVILLMLVQAFRFSFWLFQIKQRQLGCTPKQWLNWILRGQV